MKIRELTDFNFFALKEVLLCTFIAASIVIPSNWVAICGLIYVFLAPTIVVLVLSKRTWSSFTFPKAYFLSAIAVLGGILLFRRQSTILISWPVLLYAFLLAVHPLFKGMVTAIGSSDRTTGAWVRLCALFAGIAAWNLANPFPYVLKLWILAVPALALSVTIILGKRNVFYISGKNSFGREFGSMGNPMATSSLLVLSLPVFAELTFIGVGTHQYWYLLFLPLYLYGLLSSAGRGTVVGVVLSLPLVVYVAYNYSPWWLVAGLVCVLGVAWVARDYIKQLYQRTLWMIKRGIGKEPRFLLWRDALSFYIKNPLGTGYDSFRRAFMPYRSKESYLAEPTVHYDKVHNVFLEELVEGSFFALLLFVVILAQCFVKGPWVIKASLLAFVGDAFFTIYDPANWFYMWLLFILVPFNTVIGTYWLYPVMAITLFTFVLLSLDYMPQIVAGNGEAARIRGERDIAAQLFNAAYTTFPWSIDYLSEWALLQMSLLNEAKMNDEMALGYHNTFKNLEPYIKRYAPNVDDIYASWLMFCGKYSSLRNEGQRIYDLLQHINPYGMRVRKAFAHYLGNINNWDMAMSLLEENIKEYPFDADSYYMLVLACYQQSLWSTARQYFRLWKERFPNDSRLPQLEQVLGI
ncbi:O-antigen ligase family protein [Coprothermobacter platensis]|uniref:O-antigen ligase family protein n=1 Tax=Coprothermobacter platensis TaxID=108819 RepID=UPI000382819A|nr:O-antigen ligase family protein [Coprothermobacter platensis]